jgi:hydroxyethylthiazole kinase-like uncharacterized protein yjeF
VHHAEPDGARPVDGALLAQHRPPDGDDAGDKSDRGQVVVVGGDAETPGGAMLAAIAALRAGAGRAHVIVDEVATAAMAVANPELRVSALPQHARLQAAPRLVGSLERADAVVLGSGCTDPEQASSLVVQVAPLVAPGAVLVVDAAALSALTERPELVSELRERAILLPNPTEAARLLQRSDDEVGDDLERATREVLDRFGTTVAVRGATSWTATPGDGPFVDETGHPALGTSGSGDVLIGIVAGLAARGATPLGATLWGVRAHGLCGESLATELGGLGLLARDLLDRIAPVLNELASAARRQTTTSASQSTAASQV